MSECYILDNETFNLTIGKNVKILFILNDKPVNIVNLKELELIKISFDSSLSNSYSEINLSKLENIFIDWSSFSDTDKKFMLEPLNTFLEELFITHSNISQSAISRKQILAEMNFKNIKPDKLIIKSKDNVKKLYFDNEEVQRSEISETAIKIFNKLKELNKNLKNDVLNESIKWFKTEILIKGYDIDLINRYFEYYYNSTTYGKDILYECLKRAYNVRKETNYALLDNLIISIKESFYKNSHPISCHIGYLTNLLGSFQMSDPDIELSNILYIPVEIDEIRLYEKLSVMMKDKLSLEEVITQLDIYFAEEKKNKKFIKIYDDALKEYSKLLD